MSGPVALTPRQQAIKRATRDAVHAAGGQAFVAGEIGRAQSRISDYCSPNKPDFMPVDLVVEVEELGAGQPGHPHITRALARQAAMHLAPDAPQAGAGAAQLGEWLAAITRENADVVVALASEELESVCSELSPRRRAALAIEVEQQIAVLTRLLATIDGCAPAGLAVVRPTEPPPNMRDRRRDSDTS